MDSRAISERKEKKRRGEFEVETEAVRKQAQHDECGIGKTR